MKRALKRPKQPGVAELKAHLSGYLRHVKAGNDVVITERGRPVARIVPINVAEHEESRERLIKAGLLIPATGPKPVWLGKPRPRGDTRIGASVLQALIEERREGR